MRGPVSTDAAFNSGEGAEASLDKVGVEGERALNAEPLHDNEGYAVGEGEPFVHTPPEVEPCSPEQVRIHVKQPHGGAGEQPLPDFYSLRVPSAAVEEGRYLIQHERRRHELRARLDVCAPVPERRGVVLIVGRFEGDEIPRVDEGQAQSAAPYR